MGVTRRSVAVTAVPSTSPDADRYRIERNIQGIRAISLGVLALILLALRNDDRVGTLALTAVVPIALTLLATEAFLRRGSPDAVRRAGVVAMIGDTTWVTLTMFLVPEGPASPMPLLALVIALEAAARWRRVGAFVGGLVGAVLGGAWVVHAHREASLDAPIEYILSQAGITFLLALLVGGLVSWLDRLQRSARTVLDVSPDLIVTIGCDSIIRSVNPASEALLGMTPDQLVGLDYRELLDPEPCDDTPDLDLLAVLDSVGGRGTARCRFRHADGHEVWLEMSALRQGTDPLVYVVARDVTERRRAEQALEASEQRLRVLFDRNLDAVIALDLEGRISDANTAFLLLTGRDPDEEPGIALVDCVDITDRDALAEMLVDARRGRPVAGELIIVSLDDSSRHVEIDLLPIVSGAQVVGLYGLLRDVSEVKRREERLAYEVTHDPLTGLSNRVALQTQLDAVVASGQPAALLFVDLDEFKSVNDAHGHSAGDRVLVTTGERLADAVREDDFVARLAGDEFCAILHGADAESAGIIARRIEDHLGRPIDVGGRTVRISASVGIAVVEPGESSADLLSRADDRMYEAKTLRSRDPDAASVRPERRRLRRVPPRPQPPHPQPLR